MDCIKTLNDLRGRFPLIALNASPRCFLKDKDDRCYIVKKDRGKLAIWKNVLLGLSTLSFSLSVSANQVHDKIELGYWLDQAAMACDQKDKATLSQIQSDLQILFQQYPQLAQEKRYVNKLLQAFQMGNCDPLSKPMIPQQPAIAVNRQNKKQRSELR
ncbi:MAG TPA: hypothetical protein ENK78_06555, partial [Thiothrix sp.]|nr:hypothetical protein [Thiothrix sp.]